MHIVLSMAKLNNYVHSMFMLCRLKMCNAPNDSFKCVHDNSISWLNGIYLFLILLILLVNFNVSSHEPGKIYYFNSSTVYFHSRFLTMGFDIIFHLGIVVGNICFGIST